MLLPLFAAAGGLIGAVSLAPGVKRDLKEKWQEELPLVNGLAFVHRITFEIPNQWIVLTFSGLNTLAKGFVSWAYIFGIAILGSMVVTAAVWLLRIISRIFGH